MNLKEKAMVLPVGLITVLLAAFLCFACASGASATPGATATPAATATPKPPPTPSATPKPLPGIATPVASRNWVYGVVKVETTKTIRWSAFGNATDAKGIWLIVYLGIMNTAKENFGLNSWDFELRDASGVKYKPDTFTGSLFCNYRKLASLTDQYPPNVFVSAALVFDIAPNAKGLRLWIAQANTEIDLGQ